MRLRFSRRDFFKGASALAATMSLPSSASSSPQLQSPFKIAVINDEISQDFGHACEVAAHRFGMQWIELRGMWNKNILKLDDKEIAETRRILEKNKLQVTDIASPLFKVDWPGAPKSKSGPPKDQFNADFTFERQDEVLERSVELAKALGTNRVRCFDFWRLEDQAPYRSAMNEKLQETAEKAGNKGITLVLENEHACNTATGAEAAKVLNAVKSRWLMLNWDPGNAAAAGEDPFPVGYNLLPKDRIGHCHCKNAVRNGKAFEWAPVNRGVVNWAAQFEALKRDGYRHAVSLETHWRGAGTPEASTEQSWQGMKEELQKAGAL